MPWWQVLLKASSKDRFWLRRQEFWRRGVPRRKERRGRRWLGWHIVMTISSASTITGYQVWLSWKRGANDFLEQQTVSAQADRKREVWTAVCCLTRADRGRVRKWAVDPVPSLYNRHFNWLRWILNVRLTIVPLALSVRSFCFIFLYWVCKLFRLQGLYSFHISTFRMFQI